MATRGPKKWEQSSKAVTFLGQKDDAEPILSYIPQEITVAILKRLPVKSLLRFRCVNKSWMNLISSSEFIKLHLEVSTKNEKYEYHRLLLECDSWFLPLYYCSLKSMMYEKLVDSNFLPLECPFEVAINSTFLKYCNGLFCICIGSHFRTHILWNPSTRKSRNLPMLPNRLKKGISRWSGLLFTGFGYDPSNDDYKLVYVFDYSARSREVQIYSSKINGWKCYEDYQIPSYRCLSSSSISVDGYLYWGSWFHSKYCIMSLNLAAETFQDISVPKYEDVAFPKCPWRLGALENRLCLSFRNEDFGTDIWVLNKDSTEVSWTKLMSLHLPFHNLVFISRDYEILLKTDTNLELYNSKNNAVEKCEITLYPACVEGFKVVHYVESLVTV